MGIDDFKHPHGRKLITQLINLIETSLPQFPTSEEYIEECLSKEYPDEDAITTALSNYLDWISRREYSGIFRFSDQVGQGASRSRRGKKRTIDIGVGVELQRGHLIFCLEAKQVESNKYVYTDQGAIKRFKALDHGLSNSNPETQRLLDHSGIVAYAKEETFEKYLIRINRKLESLAEKHQKDPDKFGLLWSKSEILTQKYSQDKTTYTSSHIRKNGAIIDLHHFWVLLPKPLD